MRADLGGVWPLHGGAGELARLEVLAAGLRHVRAQVAVAGQLAAPRPVTRHLNSTFRHQIFSRNIFSKIFCTCVDSTKAAAAKMYPLMSAQLKSQDWRVLGITFKVILEHSRDKEMRSIQLDIRGQGIKTFLKIYFWINKPQ